MALQYLAILAGEGHAQAGRRSHAPRSITPTVPAARKPQGNYMPQGISPKRKPMGFFARLFAPRRASTVSRPGTVSTMNGAHSIQDAVLRRR
jgi:hypothetical protein